ncbi:MAG: flavodoxin [Treponema sp.]|jgi:flavodoxin|nr:flavodoxin [Treponema sp.]
MKTAVVYYSFDGNCALVAKRLGSLLNADIVALETADEKKRTGFAKYAWGGSQVIMRKKPALRPYSFDPAAYDLIILGTPVWAGSPSPAIASFLSQTKITGKRIALFVCHAGGRGKAMEKFEAMLPGNVIAGKIDFINPARGDPEETLKKTAEWVKTIGG